MNDIFDRIAASAPHNATAARVTSKGVHYEPKIEYATHEHWDAPPTTRPLRAAELRNLPDLTGTKFGRFTVVGIQAEQPATGRGLRWIVRCVCGDYEARSTKAVRNPDNAHDQCQHCKSWEVTKHRLKRDGSRPLSDFIGSKKETA